MAITYCADTFHAYENCGNEDGPFFDVLSWKLRVQWRQISEDLTKHTTQS